MADRLIEVLHTLFFGDAGEVPAAFQREMLVRFHENPAALIQHVTGTPKYDAFLARHVQAADTALTTQALQAVCERVKHVAAEAAAAGRAHGYAALQDAVRTSPEYRAYRAARVENVARMLGRTLTASQVAGLVDADDIDDLRARIEATSDEPPACEPDPVPDEAAPEDSEPDSESEPESEPGGQERVDDAFMRRFYDLYGRDATVYEYVHVRNLTATAYLTLEAIRELHAAAWAALKVVHYDLLDDTLTEADFCKRYLPQALTDSELPARRRAEVLASEGYRSKMLARREKQHVTLLGEPATAEAAEYMFEREIRSRELSLQSEQVKDIVYAFGKRTVELHDVVCDIYRKVLGREPEEQESRAVLHGFRVDEPGARDALARELVQSLEYREVLRVEIVRVAPELSTPAVFRRLEAVLKLPDLAILAPADAVGAVAAN